MSKPWETKVENPWMAEAAATQAQEAPQKPVKQAPWMLQVINPWLQGQGASKTPPPAVQQAQDDSIFEQVMAKLVQAESGGKHADDKGNLTTSPAGARGITQLMPKTATSPGFGIAPVQDHTEDEYMRVGRSYLQAMVKSFGGDYEKGLAAYNAGAGNVRAAVRKATEKGDANNWMEYLPKKEETIPYVRKIMKGISVEKKTKFQERNLDMPPGYEGKDAVFNQGLSEVLTEVQKIPEFNTMQSFLKKMGAVPKLEREFNDENLGSFTYGGKSDPGTIQTITGAGASATVIHEMVHASTRQFRYMADEIAKKSNPSKEEVQFLEMFKKTLKYDWNIGEVGDRKSKGIKARSGLAALARTLDAQWFEKNSEYRASPEELPAHGLGNQFKKAQRTSKEHLDATAATEFMMLLDIANKLKGK